MPDDTIGTYGPDEDSRDDRAEEVLLDLVGNADDLDGEQPPAEGGEQQETQEFVFSEELDQTARTYGFSDDELQQFGTEDALRLAMRAVDRQMAEEIQRNQPSPLEQPVQPQQQPQLPFGQQQQVAPSPFQQQQQQPTTQIPDQLQVELDSLGEDDPLRKGVESIVEFANHQSQQLQQVQELLVTQHQQQQEQKAQQVMTWFDSQLDEMGSELYGSSDNATPIQLQNRAAVWNVWSPQVAMAEANGGQFDADLMLKRSVNGVHGYTKQLPQDKQRAEVIRQRSKQRTAAGRARGTSQASERATPLNKLSDDADLMAKAEAILARPD